MPYIVHMLLWRTSCVCYCSVHCTFVTMVYTVDLCILLWRTLCACYRGFIVCMFLLRILYEFTAVFSVCMCMYATVAYILRKCYCGVHCIPGFYGVHCAYLTVAYIVRMLLWRIYIIYITTVCIVHIILIYIARISPHCILRVYYCSVYCSYVTTVYIPYIFYGGAHGRGFISHALCDAYCTGITGRHQSSLGVVSTYTTNAAIDMATGGGGGGGGGWVYGVGGVRGVGWV